MQASDSGYMKLTDGSPVGKSSLTVQFVDGHFVESYYPTIENTFSKVIRYRGQDFATEIVDTAGQVSDDYPNQTIPSCLEWLIVLIDCADSLTLLMQDEYSLLNSKHFIGIHGYMLVYSVNSKQSFEMVQILRDKILNHLVVRAKLQISG